jgi:hypothetical protein
MTPMPPPNITCERCGAVLREPDAVCTTCEQEFEREAQLAKEARHLCPMCAQGFDKPLHERWPRQAKWYVPTQVKPACPHCHAPLRDRKNPQLPPKLIGMFIAATIAAYGLVPPDYRKAALLVLLAAYTVAHLLRWERKVPSRERYARDGA